MGYCSLQLSMQTFAEGMPPEMVDGARVLSTKNKGLAIVLGKTYIAIDTISSDEMGYPELDMRRYPGVIWGEERPGVYSHQQHDIEYPEGEPQGSQYK